MSATSDRSNLVAAEDLASEGIPGVRAARVPAGLFLALPLAWSDGDLVCLHLRSEGGRLRLACAGALVAAMARAGHELDGAAFRGALLAHGLRHDPDLGEIACDVEGLDGFVARAVSMGAALVGILRSEPAIERIAA